MGGRGHINMQSIAHIKRFSMFIREIEIKTTMRHHFTLIRMAIIKKTGNKIKSVEDMKKLKP